MKNHRLFILVAAALIGAMNAFAQSTTFAKITTGPVVNDTGRAWGAAWGDFNNDGFIDLVVANEGADFLYRNNGNGTFTAITSSPVVVNNSDDGAGLAWADYDNDGDLDLVVAGFGGPRNNLFRNEGNGTFTNLTANLPITSGNANNVNWGDYDNDGYCDVMVAMFGPPNLLFRNNRDGTFFSMPSYAVGSLVTDIGQSVASVWSDYDNDGDLDMFVIRFNAMNALYRNNGNGTFSDRLVQGEIGELDDATAFQSNGAAWADYDNDGDLDVFVTQGGASSPVNDVLYRNNGDGTFTKMTSDIVGVLVEDAQPGASCAWADYNNDGWLDLYVANPGLTFNGGESGRANLLYRNNADGSFTQITTGSLVEDVASSNTGIWGDYDNDGFMDLFVANGGYRSQPDSLYRNDGNTNSWLKLKLIGTTSNRSAIGAKVRIRATINGTNFWQMREISGGDGFCSQNDIRPNFGLGDATNAELVRIEWPSGVVQELRNVAAKQILIVTEPPPLSNSSSQVVFIRDYLRDSNGNPPAGNATPVYLKGVEGIWLCDNAEPVLSPEGRHLTLGDLSTARGTLTAECAAQGTRVTLQLSGLVSNALYTVWLLTFKAPGYEASYTNLIGVGALGAPNGSQNVVRASATGEAQLTVIHPAGDLSEFGVVGRCLFDEFEFQTSVAYHTDGMTHGPSAGPPCTYFEQFGINLRKSQPTLTIQRAVLLSWPVAEGSFVLESAPSPDGPWTQSQAPITITGGTAYATVVAEAGNQFFRLRQTE